MLCKMFYGMHPDCKKTAEQKVTQRAHFSKCMIYLA